MSKDQPKLTQEELHDLIHRVLAGRGTSEEDEFIFDLVQQDPKVAKAFRASALRAEQFRRAIPIAEQRIEKKAKEDSQREAPKNDSKLSQTFQDIEKILKSGVEVSFDPDSVEDKLPKKTSVKKSVEDLLGPKAFRLKKRHPKRSSKWTKSPNQRGYSDEHKL